MTLGPHRCTGSGQGQGPDSMGQADGSAQSQESKIMLVVLMDTLVAGVCHGEGGEPQLLCPVQSGEAVLPKAHQVPEGAVGQWVADRPPLTCLCLYLSLAIGFCTPSSMHVGLVFYFMVSLHCSFTSGVMGQLQYLSP